MGFKKMERRKRACRTKVGDNLIIAKKNALAILTDFLITIRVKKVLEGEVNAN